MIIDNFFSWDLLDVPIIGPPLWLIFLVLGYAWILLIAGPVGTLMGLSPKFEAFMESILDILRDHVHF